MIFKVRVSCFENRLETDWPVCDATYSELSPHPNVLASHCPQSRRRYHHLFPLGQSPQQSHAHRGPLQDAVTVISLGLNREVMVSSCHQTPRNFVESRP